MAYDEQLAQRIREMVGPERGMTERRMFGGLAFLVDGKMAVAVSGSGGLMVRVDPADAESLRGPRVGPVEMRGRPMTGWLSVAPEGWRRRSRCIGGYGTASPGPAAAGPAAARPAAASTSPRRVAASPPDAATRPLADPLAGTCG